MKPLSNDKSRALALKALLADRELSGTVEFWEASATETSARALFAVIGDDGWPASAVPTLGLTELRLAGMLGALVGWQPHVMYRLSVNRPGFRGGSNP